MEKPTGGTKAKAGHRQGGPEATSPSTGGQGVHCEVESEGHEEKYRAVVDGGHLMTNRSAKGGAKVVGAGENTRQARASTWISSMSERPRSDRPRRLADWLNPTGAKKVHSLVDKVYKQKNLELAWVRVQRNDGAGGVDGQSLAD